MFKYHNLEIACLASSIMVSGNRRADKQSAEDCQRFIDTAAEAGCGLVKVFDSQVTPGSLFDPTRIGNRSRSSAGLELGDWLLPLGDYAAQRDVMIVVENALSFRSAKEMWLILDRLQHPSIACCWDVFNAALIGERPYLSVPTLNSKIQYVQLKDAKLGPLGASLCKLGEGDVPVQNFLTRLMGIGYGGYATFEWEKAWLANIAEPEEILPDAIKKMREWTKAQLEEKPGNAEPATKKPATHAPRRAAGSSGNDNGEMIQTKTPAKGSAGAW